MPRNRSLPLHLELRRSRYVWRRRWPRAARDRLGEPIRDRFFCFSLHTQLLRDAKTLAGRLTEMSDIVFAAGAEKMMAIAPETQARLLEQLARFEIEAFERVRSIADPRSPEVARADLGREEALQDTLRRALWLGDREAARAPLRCVAIHLRIALDETDPDWKARAYTATQVLLDVSQERARRQQGIYDQPTVYFRRAVRPADRTACVVPRHRCRGPHLAGELCDLHGFACFRPGTDAAGPGRRRAS